MSLLKFYFGEALLGINVFFELLSDYYTGLLFIYCFLDYLMVITCYQTCLLSTNPISSTLNFFCFWVSFYCLGSIWMLGLPSLMVLWVFIKLALSQHDLASCLSPTHESHGILGPHIPTGPKILYPNPIG